MPSVGSITKKINPGGASLQQVADPAASVINPPVNPIPGTIQAPPTPSSPVPGGNNSGSTSLPTTPGTITTTDLGTPAGVGATPNSAVITEGVTNHAGYLDGSAVHSLSGLYAEPQVHAARLSYWR